MTVTFNDPYKSEFAKIKGDKRDTYFKIAFDEAKFYKHENSYVLAGYFILFAGIPRFMGNSPIDPILCEIPIYGNEYEVRQKIADTKEYESIKLQPSIFEKMLYDYIESNDSTYIQDGKAIKGEITFSPDDNFAVLPDEMAKRNLVINSVKIEIINSSRQYPDWIPPKTYKANGYGYAAKGISPEEKVAFLKKELSTAIIDPAYKEKLEILSLSAFVDKLLIENRGKEDFLGAYLNLLNGIIS
jgi:hypothetical protein